MAFPGGGSVSDAFSGRSKISLRLNVSETQVAGTNRSTISWSLQLVETESQPSFAYDVGSTASLSFALGTGVTLYSGDRTPDIANYNYDFSASGNQTKTIGSGSFVVTHNDAGSGTITATASADALGNIGSADITGAVWTLLDFDTTPNAVATPSITRSNNGTTYSVSVTNPGTANGGPATSVFFNVYNVTTGNWLSSNSSITNYTPGNIDLSNTSQYIFRSVATNSQATEYSSNTATYNGVPSSPSSVSASRSGRKVTVSFVAGSNNGSTVTSTFIERQISGGSWVTHSSSEDLASGTYTFRVYQSNGVGTGPSTSSSTLTVPPIPNAPTSITLSRVARKVTLGWTAPISNGSSITGYVIQSRFSSDGGTTYNDWQTLGTTTSTSFQTIDLNIARTYQFNIYATSDVGNGSATISDSMFIAVYGKRYTDSTNRTDIKTLAIFTNDVSDSVVVDGVTYTKWKALESIRKYSASGWIDLQT
jgi:hypothetical protein